MSLNCVIWLIAFVLQSALLGKSMFTASGHMGWGEGGCSKGRAS